MKMKMLVISQTIALAAASAMPLDAPKAAPLTINASSFGCPGVLQVDAHPYRHCHNIATRVYCHSTERLPRNWPPFSDSSSAHHDKPHKADRPKTQSSPPHSNSPRYDK
jgi:hypothetical protein